MKEYRLTDWLPTTKKEVELRGWDELDVILFSGDAYVDHPSFGAAVIGEEQLKVIEDYMEQHDKWTVDKNCSYWSIHLWNAVVGEDAALKIRGFVCTPEKIEQAFSAFDCVEVDKDFSRAGDIYCYKDGERTELQLCS